MTMVIATATSYVSRRAIYFTQLGVYVCVAMYALISSIDNDFIMPRARTGTSNNKARKADDHQYYTKYKYSPHKTLTERTITNREISLKESKKNKSRYEHESNKKLFFFFNKTKSIKNQSRKITSDNNFKFFVSILKEA